MPDEGLFSSIPFEKRCEAARKALSQLRNDLGKIADDDLRHLQSKKEETERFVVGKSEVVRAFGLKMEGEASKIITEASQNTMRIAWDLGVKALRELYGSDAVNFALDAITLEDKKN